MLDYLEGLGDDDRAKHVRDGLRVCGNYLHFRHYLGAGEVRLHAARFCKQHLVCPLCAIRRGSKTLEAYLGRFAVIQATRPDLRPWLITFTVRDGDQLAERFGHLRGCFRRLQDNRRRFLNRSRGAPYTEFATIEGAVGSYETKEGANSCLWHPHLHMIALSARKPSQTALRHEWESITGDSFMVDVRPLDRHDDPAQDFLEVFKYAVKFGDMPLAANWHAAQVLHGRRLLFSFGLFRGVQIPESLLDEPLEGMPYFDLLYRYFAGPGYTLSDEAAPVEPAGRSRAELRDGLDLDSPEAKEFRRTARSC